MSVIIPPSTTVVMDYAVCELGVTREGQPVIRWSEHQVEDLRRNMTPEELLSLVEAMELAMQQMIVDLCGGAH